MRFRIAIVLMVALMAVAGYGVFGSGEQKRRSAPATESATQSAADAVVGAAGNYDAAMSGVCQFSCAEQKPFNEADLVAQPGAGDGDLTRCPVSGVVFTVAADRPRVAHGGADYMTCCGPCAEKLRKDPRHYLRS
jgi:hypothetical protein